MTGAALVVAFSFGLKANAATDNRPVFDLSEWQGTITADQAKLLKGEAKGVILRVQYGSNYRDTVFDHNAAILKATGVKFGVYAFEQYVSSDDAKQEAKDFYNRAEKYNPLFYANDAEEVTTYSGNSYAGATKAFASQLNKLTTKPVYLYTGKDIYNYHLDGRKGYNGVWLAYYQNTQPNVGFKYELWQHTDRMYSTALNKSVDASKFVTSANCSTQRPEHD